MTLIPLNMAKRLPYIMVMVIHGREVTHPCRISYQFDYILLYPF
jgi:hypothetical protein